MSDLGKYFPLSQKPRVDESHVTGDWSDATALVALGLADLMDALGADRLGQPSLREGWTVGDLASHLAWRLGTTRPRRVLVNVLGTLGAGPGALAAARDAGPADGASDRLRQLATATAPGSRRRAIGDLSEAVVALYDAAAATGSAVTVDPVASGAVALARTLAAPVPIRAIARGRTLVASDAKWRIGRGPELVGSASSIVLFLHGRSGVPGGG